MATTRECAACGEERYVSGATTCPNGHFICSICKSGKTKCPLCHKNLK